MDIVERRESAWRPTAGSGPQRLRVVVAAIGLLATTAALAVPQSPGWHRQLQFLQYSPLAAKWELSGRVLVPTVVDRLKRFEQTTGVEVREHTVDLALERFDLLVPERPADGRYGLIVFVAPVPEFAFPSDWKRVLDERGYLLVTARNSGNSENVLDRRIPLALHAYHNVVEHFDVDPERTFVAGFSGGSRVAQRIAMAYPEYFSGVGLFASSDPLGEDQTVPPLPDLMDRFRRHSRIAFSTGGQDLPNRKRDARTQESFSAYCIFQMRAFPDQRLGHWVPGRRHLNRVLDSLEAPPQDAPAQVEQCIGQMSVDVASELDVVEKLLGQGETEAAGIRLGELEDRFGGLAAPRSVELSRRIALTHDKAD